MSIEAMKQALEALERYSGVDQRACDAEDALRLAIEQAEKQEPDGWITAGKHTAPLRIYPLQQEKQEPVGFMNAGHVYEMQQGRLPYGYVYPREETGANVAVYTAPPAAAVQEPVAVVASVTGSGDRAVRIKWLGGFPQIGDRLYTAPPQRQPHELLCVCGASWSIDSEGNEELLSTPPQRQPLTDERVWELAANCLDSVAGRLQFARAIEAAHGITGEKPDAA